MTNNSEQSSTPFKLIGVMKSDIAPIKNLLKAAAKHHSPYIIYKKTKFNTTKMTELLQKMGKFDLLVIPKDTYVQD
jgi:hypothetical protein